MFDYQEPTGTGFLESQGALAVYRAIIHSFYSRFASLPGSGFTLREAFEELADGVQPSTAGVGWKAFPKAVIATNEQIDAQRFDFQDEYVEWRTEKAAGGSVTRITFTTEFPEYYQALATVSHDALVQGIQEVIPGANPTHMELYGPNFNPATASGAVRARRFRSQALANPWNNSQKGVLCLAQQFNTMNALFNLVGQCAIPRPDLPPGSVCANVGGRVDRTATRTPMSAWPVNRRCGGSRGSAWKIRLGSRSLPWMASGRSTGSRLTSTPRPATRGRGPLAVMAGVRSLPCKTASPLMGRSSPLAPKWPKRYGCGRESSRHQRLPCPSGPASGMSRSGDRLSEILTR